MKKTQFDSAPSLVTDEGRTLLICFGAEEVTVTTPSATDSEASESEASDSEATDSEATDSESSDSDSSEAVSNAVRTAYEAYTVRVSLPTTYEQVTSAIIDAAYPSDQMQAIINNHLLESDNAEHEAEFAAMQEWRANAKTIAKQVMEQWQASLQ